MVYPRPAFQLLGFYRIIIVFRAWNLMKFHKFHLHATTIELLLYWISIPS